MDKFIPDMYYKSIFDINYKKLKKMKIKCIAFDLDNTLASYKEDVPSKDIKELLPIISDDFKVIIFSNATKKRLTPFKEILNLDTSYSSRKPFLKKYKKIMRIYKLNPEEIAFVGDQLITDILGANRNESISILVNPIGAFEPLGTKINRFFEKFIYKKLNKTGVLNKGVYYE